MVSQNTYYVIAVTASGWHTTQPWPFGRHSGHAAQVAQAWIHDYNTTAGTPPASCPVSTSGQGM